MSIEQKRRELFEAWAATNQWLAASEEELRLDEFDGGFMGIEVHSAWVGFQAALDLVEIELPNGFTHHGGSDFTAYVMDADQVVEAIESTGLGIKVK